MEQKNENVEKNVENKYDNKNYWDFKRKQQDQQFKINVMIPPILKRDTNYPSKKNKYV
jgi:hypothetical protein